MFIFDLLISSIISCVVSQAKKKSPKNRPKKKRQPLYTSPPPAEIDSGDEVEEIGYKTWGIPKDPLSVNWGFAGLGGMASSKPLSHQKRMATSSVRINEIKLQINMALSQHTHVFNVSLAKIRHSVSVPRRDSKT